MKTAQRVKAAGKAAADKVAAARAAKAAADEAAANEAAGDEATAPKPVVYTYVGIDDISISGTTLRHGVVFTDARFDIDPALFVNDPRFEKLAEPDEKPEPGLPKQDGEPEPK